MSDNTEVTQEAALAQLNLNPTPEERKRYRARLVEISERSIVSEIMNIPLPAGLHGEWIGTDDYSQYQARQRGFVDGAEFIDPARFLHMTVNGGVVGDTKFMVMPAWKYEEDRRAAAEISARRNNLLAPQDDAFAAKMRARGIKTMDNQSSTTQILEGAQFAKEINQELNTPKPTG